MRYLIYVLVLFAFSITDVSAQKKNNEELIQLSGLVVSADSLRALPLVNVRIKGTNRGTYSDAQGFFSFVVRKSDTILFSSIGKKTVEYHIPEKINSYRVSIVQPMDEDTFYLPLTVIRPWPSQEEFNYYFVKAKIPNEYGVRARYNTRRESLMDMANSMPMDAAGNQRAYQAGQYQRYYSNGQLPPQRLFDPFAWSEFYNSWKRGDLKKKD